MSDLMRTGSALPDTTKNFDPSLRPTQDTYDALQKAYDEANYALFEDQLPNCLITLQRRARTMGYFSPKRFARGDGRHTHEMALNPAYFHECELIDTLSVLAHEMVHVWQEHFGKPGRGRYHNREFAEKSKSLGLYPSDTGEAGGKETGDRMSHYIIEGGVFERFAQSLITSGFVIEWTETPAEQPKSVIDGEDEQKPNKAGKRVKYTCLSCGQNAWAKHEAALVCGNEMGPMVPAAGLAS